MFGWCSDAFCARGGRGTATPRPILLEIERSGDGLSVLLRSVPVVAPRTFA